MIAESFLQHGSAAMDGGDRTQVIVHVSAETLRHQSAGCCEFEDGPSMSAETARRLACDASIVALIEDEASEPLSVGRKTRSITSQLRRFLKARDKGCRFPGCTNTRHVDAHHIKHWANGGETKPSNLVCLCCFHHRKMHEGGFEVQMRDDGAVRFIKVDGSVIDSTVPSHKGEWAQLAFQHAERGVHINAQTAATRWAGERCDYRLGVQVLLGLARKQSKSHCRRLYRDPVAAPKNRSIRLRELALITRLRSRHGVRRETAGDATRISRQSASGYPPEKTQATREFPRCARQGVAEACAFPGNRYRIGNRR
jgi:hypothetical protein